MGLYTVAGNGQDGFGGDGGPAALAQPAYPSGVAVDRGGNLCVADGVVGAGRVQEVRGGNGIIATVAGDGRRGYRGDGGPAAPAESYTYLKA